MAAPSDHKTSAAVGNDEEDDPFVFETIEFNSLPSQDKSAIHALASRVLQHFEDKAAGTVAPAAATQAEVKASVDDEAKRAALYARPAYSSLTPEDVQTVLSHYDIGSFVSIKELPGGLSNSNFKLQTSKGTYLLKICEEKPEPALRSQLDVLAVLRKHQFPAAYPVPMKDGSALLLFKSHRIILFDFIRGAHPTAGTTAVLRGLGKALAALHQVKDVPASLPDFPMGVSEWKPFLQSEVLGTAVEAHPFVQRLRDAMQSLAPALAAPFPERILHGDLFLENCMFDGDDFVAMIDFEEVCHGPALLDVAMTVVGCCYNELNVLKWDVTTAFLQAYHSVSPMGDLEKKHFLNYLRYSLLSIAFWRFRQFHIRRPDAARADSYMAMIQRLDRISPEVEQWNKLLSGLK